MTDYNPTDMLREMLPAGTRVLVIVTNVNSEGTSRQMRVIATGSNGDPTEITHYVADALDRRRGKHGIIVRGGGMDMRAHLLDGLSRHLHGDGHSLKLA